MLYAPTSGSRIHLGSQKPQTALLAPQRAPVPGEESPFLLRRAPSHQPGARGYSGAGGLQADGGGLTRPSAPPLQLEAALERFQGCYFHAGSGDRSPALRGQSGPCQIQAPRGPICAGALSRHGGRGRGGGELPPGGLGRRSTEAATPGLSGTARLSDTVPAFETPSGPPVNILTLTGSGEPGHRFATGPLKRGQLSCGSSVRREYRVPVNLIFEQLENKIKFFFSR